MDFNNLKVYLRIVIVSYVYTKSSLLTSSAVRQCKVRTGEVK